MSNELILFNKPFRVLSQFTSDDEKETLAQYIKEPNFYAAGRLDYDSEGLLLLTSNGSLQHLIASPKFKLPKTYWVQVEGDIPTEAIKKLSVGVELKDGITKPAQCRRIEPPVLWERDPPVRFRANIPTSWIELTITEGKNRQVRRMTAAVGFPTLRLVRYAIGPYNLDDLNTGECAFTSPTPQLIEQVKEFEQKKRNASSNRRRHSPEGKQVSNGQRDARRNSRPKPTSRTRRK